MTFDYGDGTKTGPMLVQYNDLVVEKPADPTRSGYTFAGWYLGDTLYDFDTPVTAPLTLTAEWTEVPVQNRYYYYTASADTKPDDTERSSPKTADPGVILYGAAALLSLTGMAALTGRKK